MELVMQVMYEVKRGGRRVIEEMVLRPWTALQEARGRCFARLYRLAVFVLKAAIIAVIASIFFGTLVLFATFIYWSFYMWYLPQLHHNIPAYFDFRECTNRSSVGPHATVNLLNTQWHYRHDLTLPPYSLQRLLTGGVAYDIELQLRYPDSEANRQMGMMMCSFELFHSSKEEIIFLASSTRSLLLWYQSVLVRWGRKLLLVLPLISGLMAEEELLTVPLLEGFHEHSSLVASFIKIQLSATKGCSLELLSANVLFHAKLHGLRYLMYHWFVSSAVVGIGMLISWQLIFWALVCVCAHRYCPGIYGGRERERSRSRSRQTGRAAASASVDGNVDGGNIHAISGSRRGSNSGRSCDGGNSSGGGSVSGSGSSNGSSSGSSSSSTSSGGSSSSGSSGSGSSRSSSSGGSRSSSSGVNVPMQSGSMGCSCETKGQSSTQGGKRARRRRRKSGLKDERKPESESEDSAT